MSGMTGHAAPSTLPSSARHTLHEEYLLEGDLHHIAFYRFAPVSVVEAAADDVTRLIGFIEHGGLGTLLGSVIVASEGINGMLAGPEAALDAFEKGLCSDAVAEEAFPQVRFTRTQCDRVPFRALKVKVKDEIVPLGVEGYSAATRTPDIQARDVAPADWHGLITRENVLLIDNRNSFEYEVGHFRGAVDPGVHDFRDFAQYVQRHAEEWKANGTTIAMYCTGGIRCEKSGPWMQDLGLEVYQLRGGILGYFQELPDAAEDWSGECFIFDNRTTLDAHLHETGRTMSDIQDITAAS